MATARSWHLNTKRQPKRLLVRAVGIYTVDATENGDLATKYTMFLDTPLEVVPPGSSEPEDYQSGREADALIDFVNEKVGLARTKGGGMAPTGGLVSSLDDMLASTSSFDSGLVDSLQAAVDGLTGMDATNGAAYVSVAKKVAEKGTEYVKNEIARGSQRWWPTPPSNPTRRPTSITNSTFFACSTKINHNAGHTFLGAFTFTDKPSLHEKLPISSPEDDRGCAVSPCFSLFACGFFFVPIWTICGGEIQTS